MFNPEIYENPASFAYQWIEEHYPSILVGQTSFLADKYNYQKVALADDPFKDQEQKGFSLFSSSEL